MLMFRPVALIFSLCRGVCLIVDDAVVRQNRNSALVLASCGGLPVLLLCALQPANWLIWLALAVLLWLGLYRWFTAKVRRRRAILAQPFPPRWEEILQKRVAYYQLLPEEERARFRRMLRVFLAETRITGIDVRVSDTRRVLVGASAIIPVLSFPNWEYEYLSEVLLYPNSFDSGYRTDALANERFLGLVHGELNNGVVILSAPALERGFSNAVDKTNVGIHEFVHLVDKADGRIDGIPVSLPRALLKPWLTLIEEVIQRKRRHKRDIDPYANTNPQEFLAVISEYFFERPQALAKKHPDLYQFLKRIYRQDPVQLMHESYRQVFRKTKLAPGDRRPRGSDKRFKHR